MDAAGLKIWTVGSPIGKIDIETGDFLKQTEEFRRMLEVGEILGAENIRLFSFFIPEGKNPDVYKDKVIDRLGVWMDLAKGSNITLCHENEKGIYGDVPERCLELYKIFPTLKNIFDPANYVQCGVDTKQAWAMLKEYTKYLHIKDALENGQVVPAGKGLGNVEYILKQYQAQGGDVVTIEPHLTMFDGLATLENEGNTSGVGEVYSYPSNEAAFSAAVEAFRSILN